MKKIALIFVLSIILVGCSGKEKPLLSCKVSKPGDSSVELKQEIYKDKVVTTVTYETKSQEEKDAIIKVVKEAVSNAEYEDDGDTLIVTYSTDREDNNDVEELRKKAEQTGYVCE